MLQRIIISFMGLVCLVLGASSQEPGSNVISGEMISSVESSFFSTPKSLSKGQMGKSFPLFSKKVNNYDFNLSLDYDGGNGLKVTNPGSVVGKGWKLNFEGVIIREKRGRADEDSFNVSIDDEGWPLHNDYKGMLKLEATQKIVLENDGVHFFENSGIPSPANDTVRKVYHGMLDNSHDVFHFNLMGRSGKFMLYKDGNGYRTKVFPDMNISIHVNTKEIYPDENEIRSQETAIETILSFKVIDEKGTVYIFDADDITYEYVPASSFLGGVGYVRNPEVDSWVLKSIWPNYQFPYTETGGNNAIMIDYYRHDESYLGGTRFSLPVINSLPYTDQDRTFHTRCVVNIPKTVSFPDGTSIKFKYRNWDQDQMGILTMIEVYEGANVLSKRYDLDYMSPGVSNGQFAYNSLPPFSQTPESYIHPDTFFRWYLKSLKLNGQLVGGFEYYHDSQLNEVYLMQGWNSQPVLGSLRSADHYGYPNGDMTPVPTTLAGLSSDNMMPNGSYTLMGMLKKVNYKYGAYEHFVYEPNQRDSSGVAMMVGGIRIRRHSLIDPGNPKNNKIVEYSYKSLLDTTRSSGFLGGTPRQVKYYHSHQASYPAPLAPQYHVVDFLGHNAGFSHLVGYSAVTIRIYQYEGTGYALTKRSEQEFTDLSNVDSQFWTLAYDYPIDIYMDKPTWILGHPKKVTEYDRYDRKIRMEETDYDISQYKNTSFRSLKIDLYGIKHLASGPSGVFRNLIGQHFYPVMGYVRPSEKRIYEYDSTPQNNRILAERVAFEYHPNNQVSASTYYNETGLQLKKHKYYYFKGYNLPLLTEVYNADNKLIDAVAYQYVTRQSNLEDIGWEGGTSFFAFYLSKKYQSRLSEPLSPTSLSVVDYSLDVQVGRGLELTNEYFPGNYGNIVTETNESGLKTHFLYDRFQKRIATLHNGDYDRFYYRSFETNEYDTGDEQNVNGIQMVSGKDVISGSRVYKGTLEKYLPAGRYHLKLWARGEGQLRVDGQVIANLSEEWRLYDVPFQKIQDDHLTIETANGYMDNLMIFPEGGFMTTTSYVYDTTNVQEAFLKIYATQANGMITVTEYDNLGRLINVKDHKGNIRENTIYVDPPVEP